MDLWRALKARWSPPAPPATPPPPAAAAADFRSPTRPRTPPQADFRSPSGPPRSPPLPARAVYDVEREIAQSRVRAQLAAEKQRLHDAYHTLHHRAEPPASLLHRARNPGEYEQQLLLAAEREEAAEAALSLSPRSKRPRSPSPPPPPVAALPRGAVGAAEVAAAVGRLEQALTPSSAKRLRAAAAAEDDRDEVASVAATAASSEAPAVDDADLAAMVDDAMPTVAEQEEEQELPAPPAGLADAVLAAAESAMRATAPITVRGAAISARALRQLRPGRKLTDETINAELALLAARNREACAVDPSVPACAVASSFFFPSLDDYAAAKRMLPGRPRWLLQRCAVFVVPVHTPGGPDGGHWALAVARMGDRQLEYYDSASPGADAGRAQLQRLGGFLRRLEAEARKVDEASLRHQWTLAAPRLIPLQDNDVDCGVFMLAFASRICDGKPVRREQDMAAYRYEVAGSLWLSQSD